MNIWQILLLAIIQGAAELLPVSSSAHVIVAEKLLGLDPTSPQMTLLLVMLHTGTMLAVIAYFWRSWRANYFQSRRELWPFARNVVIATACTGVLGLGLKWLIERGGPKAEVEQLFGNLGLISGALAAVGLLIIFAGYRSAHAEASRDVNVEDSCWIGLLQGLCLPFRGFSRSGATISAGLLLGAAKQRVEEFSFALAVVLTPPVVALEIRRLLHNQRGLTPISGGLEIGCLSPLAASLLGMAFSFLAGLGALRWLSRWLERGRWQYFGFYCLVAAGAVFALHRRGY